MCIFDLVALSFLLCFGFSLAVQIKNVKSCDREPLPITISVNPCQASNRRDVSCTFRKGTRVQVEAAFRSPFDSNKLEIVATAHFKGHEVPLPESGNNACLYITPGCNMKRDQLHLFTYRFDVMKYYPTGIMPVKIMIRDIRSKKVAVCATMKIEVTENVV